MEWWLLRLTVKILAFLRLAVIFFLLRLTKNLKSNLHCFKKLNINFCCGDTHLGSLDYSGKKKNNKKNEVIILKIVILIFFRYQGIICSRPTRISCETRHTYVQC